jgi:uncharacterized membrane protein
MEQTTNSNGKTAAIVGYISIIGWLISYFALHNPKTKFGSYHLKQGLLLNICWVGYNILTSIIARIVPAIAVILSLGGLVFLVLMILGIINAVNDKEAPLPVIGEKAAGMFPNI